MSAPELLVVVDPVARVTDGESARIARDVLCAGAPGAKVCWPRDRQEAARALARRGARRPVLVGDDRALLGAVHQLHRERDPYGPELAAVPVGSPAAVTVLRGLGVPGDVVAAARAVLAGAERPRDLLVDDGDGVVLGGLRIPAPGAGPPPAAGAVGTGPGSAARTPWRRVRRSLARVARAVEPVPDAPRAPLPQRLRVEADGELLADPDRPVAEVAVRTGPDGAGLAEVTVRPGRTAWARTVTVSGGPFRFAADAAVGGPVRARTWTVHPAAWRLVLPAGS
ncbi:diacylglycerol kinase [Streptomyces boncukensis]|uniref:Diacylglycerol kinase n=1 Tax=Streptomyces boncukensis TaxID=2711219 RepID=A0A6G4X3W7_9ACTN|nr:diacylglycerol kinase [Streptomyces boncukensis]